MFTTFLQRLKAPFRRLFGRDGHHLDLNSPGQLDAAFTEARQKSEETFIPPKLTPDEQLIILRRRWHLVHPQSPLPDNDQLFQLIPSGLKTEQDMDLWFYGCREEAKRAYQIALNTSWSKTELSQKLASECLEGALKLFDTETQHNIEHDVIRVLSD